MRRESPRLLFALEVPAIERVVVIGASAGGVAALERLVAGLPDDCPAAVLVALHLPAGQRSLLAHILDRAGPLRAADAVDGEPLAAGRIYVAVPDRHLMIGERSVRVVEGPRENGFRPSADVLFRSAASAWGARAVGVVLSGALDDGASGLWAIKAVGGRGIVQDPADAAYPSMPVEALRRTVADHVVPAARIGPLLARMAREPAPPEPPEAAGLRRELAAELEIAVSNASWKTRILALEPTRYTCPHCHGVLYEIREGARRRFRCHTGHGYTLHALLPAVLESSEEGLWNAVRTIEEAIALCREAGRDLAQLGDAAAFDAMLERAQRADEKLGLLRALSLRQGGSASGE